MKPLAKTPSVPIQKRGVVSLNKSAHDLIDNAETVELLHDRERQTMAVRTTDDTSPHACAVRSGSKHGPRQALASATALTAHYGINTTAIRRWKPFVEDGMLCVDLTTEGTVITGNSTKATAPADAVETTKASDEDAFTAAPAEYDSDHS